MEEFDKIKAFSESVAEREANLSDQKAAASAEEKKEPNDLDLPQYLSQFRPQMPEEKNDSNLLVWALSGLAFVLLAGIGGFFYFYGPRDTVKEIVVISPTPTPVKVRPQNPGGLQIPGTDKVVYNRTSAHKAEIVEKMFPEPEEPVLPPADQVVSVADIVELPPVPQEVESVPATDEGPMAPTSPGVAIPLFDDAVPGAGKEESKVEEPVAQPEAAPVVAEVKKEEKPVTEPVKESVPEPKKEVKVTVENGWRAQLLSSSNKSKVESAWKDISKKHKALLSDMPYQIASVKISGKGTFYRLQVGSFATKEQVVNLCAKLKKKKLDCIPVK